MVKQKNSHHEPYGAPDAVASWHSPEKNLDATVTPAMINL